MVIAAEPPKERPASRELPSEPGSCVEELSIRVRNLCKTYPNSRGLLEILRHPIRRTTGVVALQGIDFEAYSGEIFGLLGPNGAGKTTLLKILANLVLPTSGDVLLAGCDLLRNPRKARRCIGYVPSDERNFFWRLSGQENLRFFADIHEVPPRLAAERIRFYLDYFGLQGVAGKRFALYSTGQKKLFTIIRALLPAPRILILDEPTNSLDPPATKRLVEHLRRELVGKEHQSIIWATHRLEEASDVCDRILLIDKGKARFCGLSADFHPRQSPEGGHLSSLLKVFEKMIED